MQNNLSANFSMITTWGPIFTIILLLSLLCFFIFLILFIVSVIKFFKFKNNKDKKNIIIKNIKKNFYILIISLIIFLIIDKIGLILGMFIPIPGSEGILY